MASLGDFLKAINYTKEDVFVTDNTAEHDYIPFIVNKSLSYFVDTVLIANEMNQAHELPKKMQFDFYRGIVRHGKRFSRWHKKDNLENIDIVKEYFQYSHNKAEQALKLLTSEDIIYMKNMLRKGGKTNG